ncbi:MAG: type II toxin-antitoxin system VapC family toxin [Bryobacteraceae bacterium]|nr:type II toxin-antitoxin system VapC family toxin [Bryobacteraceae bacterium]
MSGWLLDTNVLSEASKLAPNPDVGDWVDTRDSQALWVSVISLGEIRQGIESARRRTREAWLTQELLPAFSGRILDVDREVAYTWGRMTAKRLKMGRPLPIADGLIAAAAQVHSLTLVTRNVEDFASHDVAIFNPWKSR